MNIKISQLVPFVGSLNRLIVEPFPIEEKRESGIIDTEAAAERPLLGTVITISEQDHNSVKPTLKVGDTVMFGKGQTKLPVEDKTYLLMTENDVHAKIKMED